MLLKCKYCNAEMDEMGKTFDENYNELHWFVCPECGAEYENNEKWGELWFTSDGEVDN